MAAPHVQHFYHAETGTLSYVVSDPASRDAAVVDPVLGLDIASGRTDDSQVADILQYLGAEQLKLRWILETHAHADHLSGAQPVKARAGGSVAIGAGICDVQEYFAKIFNLQKSFRADGHQFDKLLLVDEEFAIGELRCRVIPTPGHTSDSVTYLIGDAAFVGDSLFMPDAGTARCDFPGGDAGVLYDSIQRLFALPPDTRLFVCHDYQPDGRELRFQTTIAEQAAHNIHVGKSRTRDDFIALRERRDATLQLPRLIIPSIQVNIRAGRLPAAENNEVSYLKIPINHF
ncbi:MAG: MBL fold metallo-hydrolase [Woeseia sp.]|nr:MBL fold metallo-hydrolase [Woeseia sp.]MBT8097862.1 MBL fold metallo-hydrolase [Woeseia sp.]